MPTPTELWAFLDGRRVGIVTQTPQGQLTFSYDDDYRHRPDATPLSLSMPLAAPQHRNKAVRAYLDGLLPDSQPARERWGQQYAVSPNNPFALLRHVGRDAAGAVQLIPPGAQSDDAAAQTGDIDWLSEQDFKEMVHDLVENDTDWNPGRFGGRWSLAGAQSKIALFRDPTSGSWGIPRDSTPTTHIIKPGVPGFDNHHINEVLCQRAAAEAGLLASHAELVETGDVRAVISRRYDRRRDDTGRWHRIHQEDLCQALSVHPSLKYQSDGGPGISDVADLIAGFQVDDRRVSAERFFTGVAFNTLIGGTDAHAKNYSVVLIGRRAQMAPLYDLASAAAYPQNQRLISSMKIGDHWKMLDVTNRDWAKVGRRFGIQEHEATGRVEQLRADLPQAFEQALATLPESAQADGEQIIARIVDHVHGNWRPDHTPPRHAGPAGARVAPAVGQHRAKTTPASNTGSFAPRQRPESDTHLSR
jgi:serine/threonine-protein kinase HipA